MDARAELWTKVDRLLWVEWDPIGINDYGGPDDEYRGYVPEVVSLLERNASSEEIAKSLSEIATKTMGLSLENHEHSLSTAIKLKALLP